MRPVAFATRLLAPLSWLLGADAYASYMVTRFCDRPLTVGTQIMCCAARSSTMRTVSFRRNGVPIPCGSGSYVPGETLTAHITSVSGQYVFEVSGGDARLSTGGCPGRVRRSQANGAEVRAPTDGSVLSLKAGWAVANYGQVYISPLCELRVATTQTTATTVTATTVTATTVTATTVTATTVTATTVTATATTTTATTNTATTITATTTTVTIVTSVTTTTFTAPTTMTDTTDTMTSITATVTTITLTTTALTTRPVAATTVPFTPLPFAEGQTYASVGGPGIVAADEGFTIGAYKEDCSASPDDTCFQAVAGSPDLAFCEQQCTSNAACNSFAYCTGNSGAPFPRCYLKTRRLDFATKLHVDCTTFKADGSPLLAGHVARTEGVTLASFKEACTGDEFDTCHQTAPTFSTCLAACAQQDGCASFAYCTGIDNPGTTLQRCYLKAGNFSTVAHGAGDCASFYPRRAAKCTHLNEYYRRQQCCGQPGRELDLNQARPGGVQPL